MLSAALDSGVAVSVVIIFFCLQFPKNGSIGLTTVQSWWGNTVSFNTADGLKTPLLTVPDGETFGYAPSPSLSPFYSRLTSLFPQPEDMGLMLMTRRFSGSIARLWLYNYVYMYFNRAVSLYSFWVLRCFNCKTKKHTPTKKLLADCGASRISANAP